MEESICFEANVGETPVRNQNLQSKTTAGGLFCKEIYLFIWSIYLSIHLFILNTLVCSVETIVLSSVKTG